MPTERKSGFQNALKRTFSEEGFANIILPIAGIIESIASKGQSPGVAATQQRQLMLDDIQRREQRIQAEYERKQKELDSQGTRETAGLQRDIYKQQLAESTAKTQRELEEENKNKKFIQDIEDLNNDPWTPEEAKPEIRKQIYEKQFPEKAAAKIFNPTQDYYDMLEEQAKAKQPAIEAQTKYTEAKTTALKNKPIPSSKDPTAREKAYSVPVAKEIGNLGFYNKNLYVLRDALQSGDVSILQRTPLGAFKNPTVSTALKEIDEMYARGQSGAAINNAEWKNFRSQILSKTNLLTPEGRAAALDNTDNFIAKNNSIGKDITKNENWYQNYLESTRKMKESQTGSKTVTLQNIQPNDTYKGRTYLGGDITKKESWR